MTTPPTPAGWYPDPDGSGGQRYWDGSAWTEHRSPAAPSTPETSEPAAQAEPPGSEQPTVVVPTRPAPQEEHVGAHRAPEPEPEPEPEPSAQPTTPSAPGGNRKLLVGYGAACAALLAVLVFVVVYGVFIHDDGSYQMGASGDTTTTSATSATPTTAGGGWGQPTETATDSPTTAVELQEASDGPMAFMVWGVEKRPSVTSQDAPIEKAAVGEYVVVQLTVTNTSDAPATFLGTLQKLNAGGTVYSIDDEATFYVGGGLAELNPGDQADVSVAFDVPPGTAPESIQLHADPLSPGVQVPLA